MSGKQFLYILIATLITVVVWAAMDIIHTQPDDKTTANIKELLEPVNPTFDLGALETK